MSPSQFSELSDRLAKQMAASYLAIKKEVAKVIPEQFPREDGLPFTLHVKAGEFLKWTSGEFEPMAELALNLCSSEAGNMAPVIGSLSVSEYGANSSNTSPISNSIAPDQFRTNQVIVVIGATTRQIALESSVAAPADMTVCVLLSGPRGVRPRAAAIRGRAPDPHVSTYVSASEPPPAPYVDAARIFASKPLPMPHVSASEPLPGKLLNWAATDKHDERRVPHVSAVTSAAVPPAVPWPVAVADGQPVVEESLMPEAPQPPTFASRLSADAKAAAYQVAAAKLTELTAQSLGSLLQRSLPNESPEVRARIGKLLESEMGEIGTALILSALVGPLGGMIAEQLGASPKKLESLASALRVHAMVSGGSALVDVAFQPLLTVAKDVLRNLPDDEPVRQLPERQVREVLDVEQQGVRTGNKAG